jgi:hypothetical protein
MGSPDEPRIPVALALGSCQRNLEVSWVFPAASPAKKEATFGYDYESCCVWQRIKHSFLHTLGDINNADPQNCCLYRC